MVNQRLTRLTRQLSRVVHYGTSFLRLFEGWIWDYSQRTSCVRSLAAYVAERVKGTNLISSSPWSCRGCCQILSFSFLPSCRCGSSPEPDAWQVSLQPKNGAKPLRPYRSASPVRADRSSRRPPLRRCGTVSTQLPQIDSGGRVGHDTAPAGLHSSS